MAVLLHFLRGMGTEQRELVVGRYARRYAWVPLWHFTPLDAAYAFLGVALQALSYPSSMAIYLSSSASSYSPIRLSMASAEPVL